MESLAYGESVFSKVNEDGSVRDYPGNTIVMMVDQDSEVFKYLMHMTKRLKEIEASDTLMLLPPSSYHMTVVSGVNDQVREEKYWSRFRDLDTPLEEISTFFQSEMKRVKPLKDARMLFDKIQLNHNDLRVLLKPETIEEDRKLRAFRDEISEQFGVRMPNHDEYTFHITLAYVWKIPNNRERNQLSKYKEEVDKYLSQLNNSFTLSDAQFVSYRNMFDFPGECKQK